MSTEVAKKKIVTIGDILVGQGQPIFMGGPCTVESLPGLEPVVEALIRIRGETGLPVMLRGGVNKPRTNAESFQGLGRIGLEMLAEMRHRTGILIAIEIRGEEHIEYLRDRSLRPDLVWIGSRNGLNQDLISKVALVARETDTPIMIKRHWGATVSEWLGAAGYAEGAWGETTQAQIILCERGIRIGNLENPFSETILDLRGMWEAQIKSGWPIIVDASHSTKRRDRVETASIAALEHGADGLMVEIHSDAVNALSDNNQQISPREAIELARTIVNPDRSRMPRVDWIRYPFGN